MKFRTEIDIAPFERKIGHSTNIFSIGSCFAESIAAKLRRYKFRVGSNHTGTLYNPFSIADVLEDPDAVAGRDCILVTFGTAWVYELGGRVVANCGKQPAHLFTRRRLSVEEIVGRFSALLDGPLADRQVIFTVSPIRHMKDGFAENSLSKAVLRVAVGEIVERNTTPSAAQPLLHRSGTATYFPSFEILMDDLRDYRFYKDDMAHPADAAVDYIWEKFSGAAFSGATLAMLPRIETLRRAMEHRPFDTTGEAYRKFRETSLGQALELQAAYPGIDFSDEIEFFRH